MTRFLLFSVLLGGLACTATADVVRLDQLDLNTAEQDLGEPHGNISYAWKPITLGTNRYEHGFGTHANSTLLVDLFGQASRFTAIVGLDGEVPQGRGSVEFVVIGDDKTLWRSGVMRGKDPAKEVSVDLSGLHRLTLRVEDAGDGHIYDYSDWAEAAIEYSAKAPKTTTGAPPEEPVILTPSPKATPRINGPKIFGVRPGHPILYRLPITGERPMKLSVKGLPKGLQFDAQKQMLTGVLKAPGPYKLRFQAQNKHGRARKDFTVVVGDTLALTPPMGWNSWNCFAEKVDAATIRMATDAMVDSGLIEHGWAYINIDDTWEAGRDAAGNIQCNSKFPDMKGLTAYAHDKGLKIGLYSSPGPKTCGGYEGSWRHEEQDARQYAAWGFDYLKYDWCSYSDVTDKTLSELDQYKKPYRVMGAALRAQDRDIVFSLCQYGMGAVWEWGAEVGGNCWRTTGDIRDAWSSVSTNGFSLAGRECYVGPGRWNDPDMLVVGNLGWGKVRPCDLTPSEQYAHISLWCLVDSPLLIGCDLSHLDEFTKNLLSNDDVLEVNQDALGRQAAPVAKSVGTEIWAKEMSDHSKAVGLFNCGSDATVVEVKWSDLGLSGKHRVRDLWRQQDLGEFESSFPATVSRHGVVLVRVW